MPTAEKNKYLFFFLWGIGRIKAQYYYILKMVNKDIQNYIEACKVILILCNQWRSLRGMPNMKSLFEVFSFSLQLFSVVKKKCKILKLEFFFREKDSKINSKLCNIAFAYLIKIRINSSYIRLSMRSWDLKNYKYMMKCHIIKEIHSEHLTRLNIIWFIATQIIPGEWRYFVLV